MLEALLKGSKFSDLIAQEKVQKGLNDIAYKIKKLSYKDVNDVVKIEIAKLNDNWPQGCQLILDPGFICKGVIATKCKVLDTKMRPLWLLFENADSLGENMYVIYKVGEDLHTDILTLQMIRIMDKIWKKEDLNLGLNPYNIIMTSDATSIIEVVNKSQTISKIQKAAGGAIGAFKENTLFQYLKQVNPEERLLKTAVENFTASCAGYCVASYILGIGDRHNDNMMIKEDGHLFHIDFNRCILGLKKWFGFRRERPPFVFIPDFAYVMGGKNNSYYKKFTDYCNKAHKIIRKNYKLFINLFSMMLTSGIPELQTKEDLMHLVEILSIDKSESQAYSNFQAVLDSTLNQSSTKLSFYIHNLVH